MNIELYKHFNTRNFNTKKISYLVREHIAECDLLESEVEYKESEEELIICHTDLIFYLTSDVFHGERFGVWLDNAKYYHFTSIKR